MFISIHIFANQNSNCGTKTSCLFWQYTTVAHSLVDFQGPFCQGSWCLIHQGIQDKHWVSDIDGSQPRHEAAFWWCRKGPMMSHLTDLFKGHTYPWHLIVIYGHINTCDKESMTPRWSRSTPVQLCLIYLYIDGTGVLVDGVHNFAPQITILCITIRACATMHHFLIWMRTVRQKISWCHAVLG